MAQYKILPENLLTGNFDDLDKAELTFHNYAVAIAFTRNQYCLLSSLQLRFDPASDWKIAASNLGAHEGQIIVPLGMFDPAATLHLFWVINAPVTKIDAVAIYVINTDTKKMVKVAPAARAQAIAKQSDWMDRNESILLNF